MAVSMNVKGTTIPYFQIGKGGVTLYQGPVDPSGTYTVNTGDYWFDTNNHALKSYAVSAWSGPTLDNISISSNTISSTASQDLTLTPASGVLIITGTGATQISTGTTAQRPLTPAAGYVRFNTTTGFLENYTGSAWTNVSAATPAGTNSQVQFNDGGALGADAALTYTRATGTLASTVFSGSGANLTSIPQAAVSSLATDLGNRELVANKSNDGTLATNSSTLYPTEQATKTYVDTSISALAGTTYQAAWIFKTGTNSADPGGGNFSYNSATLATVTEIYVDKVTTNSIDMSKILTGITGNTQIYIHQRNNSDKACLFSLNGSVINNTNWFIIPVIVDSFGTGGLPTNNSLSEWLFINNNVANPATYTGTATLDFGTAPGTDNSTAIVSLPSVTSGSTIQVWMMAETTATHNTVEHRLVQLNLTAGDIINGTSFTIFASTHLRLTGTFNVKWQVTN